MEQLCALAPKADITYADGYHLSDGNQIDATLLDEAVRLAQSADNVILFVGLTEQYEAEGTDRNNMKLPDAHNELVARVLASTPVQLSF